MIIIIIVSIYPSLPVNDSILKNLSDQLSVSDVGTSGIKTQQKAEGQNYKQRQIHQTSNVRSLPLATHVCMCVVMCVKFTELYYVRL